MAVAELGRDAPPLPARILSGLRVSLPQLQWFLVPLSWLPLIVGFSAFVDYFVPWARDDQSTLPTLAAPQPLAFALLAAAIFAIAMVQRKWLYLLLTLAPIAGCFVGAGDETDPEGIASVVTYVLYLQAFSISFLIYCWNARIRSAHFAAFILLVVGLLVVEAIVDGAMNGVLGLVMKTYTLSVFDLAMFLSILILGRFVALLIIHNRDFVRGLANWKTGKTAGFAALLWSPMLLLYLLFGWVYGETGKYLERVSVDHLLVELQPDQAQRDLIPLDAALQMYTDKTAEDLRASASTSVAATNAGVRLAADEAVGTISPEIHNAFPRRLPGSETRNCGFFDVLCLVMNGIKSMTNSAYVNVRGALLAQLDQQLEQFRTEARARGDDLALTTIDFLNAKIADAVQLTREAINKIFKGFRDLSFVVAVYTFIMLVKSYLFVFARVLFRTGSGLYASVAPSGTAASASGKLSSDGEQRVLTFQRGRKFLITPRVRLLNVPPQTRIPQPLVAPIPRIVSRTYFMNLADASGAASNVSVMVDDPADIIEWTLKPDERVVFSFGDLVGFSDDLKLRTLITVRIESFIFGQMVFREAIGPGVLLLRTHAKSNISRVIPPDVPRPYTNVPAQGLIAWNTPTQFQIGANYSVWDTLFSGHNIVRQPADQIVYDTSTDRANAFQAGIARFIKYFVLPI